MLFTRSCFCSARIGLATLAYITLATPALADSVSTAAANGYGRILFTLDPIAHAEAAVSGGVLTIHFDRRVAVEPSGIARGLAAYVSAARLDSDGQTLRLALTEELKTHSSASANRVAVDLVPTTFNGTPPELPPAAASAGTPRHSKPTVSAQREKGAGILRGGSPSPSAERTEKPPPGMSTAQLQATNDAAAQINGVAPKASALLSAPAAKEPAKASDPQATTSKETSQLSAVRNSESLTLQFPSARAVAAFVRANTAWIVVEGGPEVDVRKLAGALGDYPSSVTASTEQGAAVLRVGLKRTVQLRTTSMNGSIAVTMAPSISGQPSSVALIHSADSENHPALSAVLPGAADVLMLPDPVVGDTLAVVPAQPGTTNTSLRRFLELSVLPSAAGLIVQPIADNVHVTATNSSVLIARPGGLTLSDPDPLASVAAMQPGSGGTFIDFARGQHGPGKTFLSSEQMLRRRAASADPGHAFAPQLALARFYIANRLNAEALGIVRLMQADSPRLQNDAGLKVIAAAASYMVGRYRDTLHELAGPEFQTDANAALWEGLADAELEEWPAARKALQRARGAFALYPLFWRGKAQIALAKALAKTGDIVGANQQGAKLATGHAQELASEEQLMHAELYAASGQTVSADELFRSLERGAGEAVGAQALYNRVLCDLRSNAMSKVQAIEALESLRFRWRGGPLELDTLRTLASLYFSQSKWREGLQTLRLAAQQFPDEQGGRLAQAQMRSTFEDLFLKGKAAKLSTVDALATFYQFVDLTPLGPEGDEMIRRMADRLVAVDLLGPAAKLLKYQVENRLDGVARAQVATRLAKLELMNQRPSDALAVLRETNLVGLPDELTRERDFLEAQALTALRQWPAAVTALGGNLLPEAQALKAEINWQSQNWSAAGGAFEEILPRGGARFSTADRQHAMRAAIAYANAGDRNALNRLRASFLTHMQGSPEAGPFALITRPWDDEGVGQRDGAAVASLTALHGLVEDSKHRLVN